MQRSRQSPYRSQQYRNLQHSKQDIVRRLQTVFTYFCGRASKYNYQDLQEKYFMEMGIELFTLAGRERDIARLSPKWLDLTTLYHSKGRNKQLRLKQFLDLLPSLAMVVFSNERTSMKRWDMAQEQQTAMKNLLLLFDKLYTHILDEELYRKGIRSEEIAEDTKEFLLKLRDSLTKLYKVYFEYEYSVKDKNQDYQQRSFEAFLQFMKDFEVYPKLASASQLYFIYQQLLCEQQHNRLVLLSPSLYSKGVYQRIGECFTLPHFVESIILTSRLTCAKLRQGEQESMWSGQLSQKGSVKQLLQYMQTMRTVKEKPCKHSKQRFSLIVYEEYAEQVRRETSLVSSPSRSMGGEGEGDTSKRSFYNILNRIDL